MIFRHLLWGRCNEKSKSRKKVYLAHMWKQSRDELKQNDAMCSLTASNSRALVRGVPPSHFFKIYYSKEDKLKKNNWHFFYYYFGSPSFEILPSFPNSLSSVRARESLVNISFFEFELWKFTATNVLSYIHYTWTWYLHHLDLIFIYSIQTYEYLKS